MKIISIIVLVVMFFGYANAQSPKIDGCRQAAFLVKKLWDIPRGDVNNLINRELIAPLDKGNIIGLHDVIKGLKVPRESASELAAKYYIACVNRN
jgi:hypothetical protein